jgi:hypothetical protein
MNHVCDFEAGKAYLTDTPELVIEVIPFKTLFFVDVGEDTIALALPDIEGLTVTRVDEPIDIGLELIGYLCRERIVVWAFHRSDGARYGLDGAGLTSQHKV